ncbi:response regulator [Frigoribacterium salinisoli]
MIRVLVVDDHPLVRAGLRALVDGEEGVQVVAEAADGERSLDAWRQHRPDVVLMDLSMPGIGGVEATRRLVEEHPDARVVVLTSVPDAATVREALGAGAVGYLLKDADPASVVAGVRAAAAGDAPLDPRAARAVLPARGAPPATVDRGQEVRPEPAPPVAVAGREADVLRLIAQGLANKQIGQRLGISERTVKAHAGSLFRRIGVADRTSAALWARDHGY